MTFTRLVAYSVVPVLMSVIGFMWDKLQPEQLLFGWSGLVIEAFVVARFIDTRQETAEARRILAEGRRASG